MKPSTTERMLASVPNEWGTTSEIAQRYGKAVRTTDRILKQLLCNGRVTHKVVRVDEGCGHYLNLWRKPVAGAPEPLYELPEGLDARPLADALGGLSFPKKGSNHGISQRV